MTFFRSCSRPKLGLRAMHHLSIIGIIISVVISWVAVELLEAWVRESIETLFEPIKASYREQHGRLEDTHNADLPGTLSVSPRIQDTLAEFLPSLSLQRHSESISLGARIPKEGSAALPHYFGCIINSACECGANLARNDKFVGRFIGWHENRTNPQIGCGNGSISLKISKQIKV